MLALTRWRAWFVATTPSTTDLQSLAASPRLTWLDGAVLAIWLSEVALHSIAARLAVGWWTAAATDGLLTLALVGLAWRAERARPFLSQLLLFGLVAGIVELFTDFSGELVGSLRYPLHEPMLWVSPLYMPLSWMIVLVELGYLAWRLAALLDLRWATLLTALAGAAVIPFYEEMAYHAGWWRYAPIHALGHTPAYVLLFEGLVAAALPWLLALADRRTFAQLAVRGLLLGLWMPWAALLAWLVLGR